MHREITHIVLIVLSLLDIRPVPAYTGITSSRLNVETTMLVTCLTKSVTCLTKSVKCFN
jgi:hypothetical protein